MTLDKKTALNVWFLMKKKRCGAGFTVVEIMIVLSIVAILAILAAPSFSNIMASRSAKSAAAELFSSLVKARSEAIVRNANVTLLPISGSWQNGWQVVSPTNVVLESRGAIKGATVTGPASIVYRSSGRISGTAAPSFVITATGAADIYQCVSVNLTGRPYSKAASTC